MTVGGRARCPGCGAQLRRGRPAGEYCDPCRRSGGSVLPEGFYDQGVLQAALAEFNFGPVFCAVRTQKQCSQQTLGEFLGWEQRRISAIETGRRALVNLPEVVHVANTLGIPAGKLGFRYGVTVGAGSTAGRTKGSGVQRRDFGGRVAALALGAGVVGLDLERLIALLPEEEPTGTRHVGAADVEAIEQATASFMRADFAQGSGLARDLAITQLRTTLPLLGAQTTPEVGPRLYLATARLATQAGWMSFDVTDDEAARRLWLIGLEIARAAEDPQGSDLTVYLLADMALQALRLNRPDEALRLVHLGHAAAAGPHPVSASTTSLLASIQARAHATQGDTAGCDRALDQALEHAAAIDLASAPPWTAYLAHTGVAGHQGTTYYTLALHGQDPHAASRAVPLLRHAIGLGPDYARGRALCLPDLSGAHAIAGDIDTAVTVGHQAVDVVTALHSPRAYERLRVLHTALGALHTSPGVAELRSRLAATLA